MHVLIIGGTRFVGYLLTWRLLAAGRRVTLFNRGTLPDPFGDRVERLRGDRTTADFARLLGGRSFDAVVDFAAFTGEDANGVVETLRRQVGHYVFISTGQVYLVRTDAARPYRETDYDGPLRPEPTGPDDRAGWAYGIGKRDAEDRLARAWTEERFPATSLRVPMVNGERDYYRRIESYLVRILDGGPVLLPDGGVQPCRHIYGADLAAAIAELFGRPETFGRAYNLCQQEEPRLAEVVRTLADLLGAPARLHSVPTAAIEAHGLDPRDVSPFSGRWMSHLDPTRAVHELGFHHTPTAEYLGRIAAAFLAHPPPDTPPGYRNRAVELEIAVERRVRSRVDEKGGA